MIDSNLEKLQKMLLADTFVVEDAYQILGDVVSTLQKEQNNALKRLEKSEIQFDGLKKTLIDTLEKMEMDRDYWKVVAETLFFKIEYNHELPQYEIFLNQVKQEVGRENYTKPTIIS